MRTCEGASESQEREEQAGAALVELDRLTRLFQDILDMARIDAAAIYFEPQWVTPADVVDAASAQVRHALNGHALRVDADEHTEIEIDPRVASVALSHLLENAAQYSPADRESSLKPGTSLTAFTSPWPTTARVSNLNELDHLFERFYRGRSAKQLSPGTGLGLAITRGLLTAAGGRVWGENAPGAGARFTIVVPGRTRPRANPPDRGVQDPHRRRRTEHHWDPCSAAPRSRL